MRISIFLYNFAPENNLIPDTMRKILLTLLCFVCLSASAITLHVEQLNASDFELAVYKIGKMVFVGETVVFYDRKGNVLEEVPLGSMKAMTFTEEKVGLFQVNDPRYVVYPNPTSSLVLIKGLSEPTTLRLFSLEGSLVKSEEGTEMHMDGVPAGQYFLQFKTNIVKIIKQ